MKATRKTPAERAAQANEIAERRRKVAAFLLARVEQREIARQLNVSEATISKDAAAIRVGWRAEATGYIAEATQQELATLNADEAQWRAKLQKASSAAALAAAAQAKKDEPAEPEKFGAQLAIYDRILKIMERRARLLGIDAPVKQDLTTNGKDITSFAALMQAATNAPE